MKRAIVTGATGFVGCNLTRRLLSQGHEVHLLVRPGHASWRIEDVRRHVQIHVVDLGDQEGVERTVAATKPDWVFHLAAYGAYSSQKDVARIIGTNFQATVALVDACVRTGFESFVNTGSSSEYGFKDHAPSETDHLEPNSHYAVAKASATLFCRYTAQSLGIAIPTLRLYSVYGPYEEPTRLIPTLILHGLRGKLPPLVDPDVGRDFVSVDDVCDAYLLAAVGPRSEPGAVYNVGTGVQTSIRDVVEVARRTLGVLSEPVWGSMPDRTWDTHTWVSDSRRIQRDLGWHPKLAFAEGFRHLVDWLRDNPLLREEVYDPGMGWGVTPPSRLR